MMYVILRYVRYIFLKYVLDKFIDRFPPPQFGLIYAMLSSATNVIGTLGPGVANALAYGYGWRLALQLPAILSLLAAAVGYFVLWDRPSDVGYEDQYSRGKTEFVLDK